MKAIIYVVVKQSFWSNSGTNAVATFINKESAKSYADSIEDRTDLKSGCQCFVISRTEFNKKFGINKVNEKYLIDINGDLESEEYTTESFEFENKCEL